MGPFLVVASGVALVVYGVALVLKREPLNNVRPLTGPIGIVKPDRPAA